LEKKLTPAVLREGRMRIRCRYPRAFSEALENSINGNFKPAVQSSGSDELPAKSPNYLITGTVNDTGFELNRVVVQNEKRFTLQTIRGKVEPRRDGTCTIEVKFEPTPFALRMLMLCDIPLYVMFLDGFCHYVFGLPSLMGERWFLLMSIAGAMWIVAEAVQYFMRNKFHPDRELVEHVEAIAGQVEATVIERENQQ
jgi:hypothetical protein